MIKFEKKKAPPSVRPPVFSVRLSEQDVSFLNKELESLTALINETRPADTKEVRKNQVFLEAIKIGLAEVKSSYKRRKTR